MAGEETRVSTDDMLNRIATAVALARAARAVCSDPLSCISTMEIRHFAFGTISVWLHQLGNILTPDLSTASVFLAVVGNTLYDITQDKPRGIFHLSAVVDGIEYHCMVTRHDSEYQRFARELLERNTAALQSLTDVHL